MTISAHKLLTILFAAYPIETINVAPEQALATARIYAKSLEDLDERLLVKAIDQLVKTSKRLPTIAHIREEVLDLQHGPARAGGDAWGDVQHALRRHGRAKRPGTDFRFDDPLVARAVERLGWSELCGSENSVADRKQFIELYERYVADARTAAQAAQGAVSALLPGPPTSALLPGGQVLPITGRG